MARVEPNRSTQFVTSHYNRYVDSLEKSLGNKVTFEKDLNLMGRKLFGNNFRGVFPKDKQPKLKRGQSIIVNLDASTEPGSHWIAKYNSGGKDWVYDSYGRKNIVKEGEKVKVSEEEKQKKTEKNCGPRSLAWLMTVYKYGVGHANRI